MNVRNILSSAVHIVARLGLWMSIFGLGGSVASAPAPTVTPEPDPESLGEAFWFDTPNALEPRGFPAERIADLWWFMFGLGTFVFVVVMVLLLIAVFRRRGDRPSPPLGGTRFVITGVLLSTVIIASVLGFTLYTLAEVAAPPAVPAVAFEVVGHQWWWEIRYAGEEITANELHIPVGVPVRLTLLSADVIHSFWVPQLSGKTDMIPGQVNYHWLLAEEPGIYRGQCAEFCGVQHARMAFFVVAEPEEEFRAWLGRMRSPAVEVTGELAQRGEQVFFAEGCVNCHSVRGRQVTGEFGPDLTHIGSRLSIGAGVLRNNFGNLAGWVANPQPLKPGNYMPPQKVDPRDLPALVTYLMGLE